MDEHALHSVAEVCLVMSDGFAITLVVNVRLIHLTSEFASQEFDDRCTCDHVCTCGVTVFAV